MATAAVVFALLVLVFAALAGGLSRVYVTAPIAFVAAGAVLSTVTSRPSVATVLLIKTVAEVALALILFHDAAHVRPRHIGREAGVVVRLLFLALPITVLLGFAGARLLFPHIPAMTALLLAAALAPTDAGLGAATVLNPVVPVRIRRLLNLEAGLNDGLITPVVLFAIAGVAGARPGIGLPRALVGALAGALVGAIVGALAGLMLGWSLAHNLSSPHTRSLGVLGIPILAFFLAETLGANAFVSAFVAGTAFTGSATWADSEDSALRLTESLSEPLAFAVWLVFGLAATPVLRSHVGWREGLYAALSLTAFRMVPTAVSFVGTRFRWQTVAFVAWFGPRGLPTVVFALIALENLEVTDSGRGVIATAALTVLLSVLAHGLTADVLAARYGAWVARVRPSAELAAATEPRARHSVLAERQVPG